jgi:hypothetical protein
VAAHDERRDGQVARRAEGEAMADDERRVGDLGADRGLDATSSRARGLAGA